MNTKRKVGDLQALGFVKSGKGNDRHVGLPTSFGDLIPSVHKPSGRIQESFKCKVRKLQVRDFVNSDKE